MTRVLAVSLSAAMTFSLSAANMATASAASNVVLSPSTVTLQYGTSKAKKTLKLKNNTQNWKVKSASVAEKGSKAKGKKVLTVTNTTSKVVLKAKNIKKSHKVTVSVKVKRTKNKKTYTKTLKCKVTVKPQSTEDPDDNKPDEPDTPSSSFSTSANATSKSSVDVTFSQAVDQASLVKENFKVDAEGVEVTNVDAGDGRNVRLTISGADSGKDYTLNITGLTLDGKALDAQSVKFHTPTETAQGYTLKLASNTNQIKADGYAEALITCEVRDPQGNLVKDKDYTIRFTSDRGSFSRPDSVTAEGVASNVLRSEALDVAQDVTITAQIIRVEGTDDAGLVGKQDTMTVNMTPILANIVVNPIEGAESNQADRLTLHFQNKVDDDTYKTNGVIDTSRINIEVYDNISKLNSLDGGIDYSTDNGGVVNLVPVAGDDKALQVLVNGALQDNRYVGVRVKMTDPNSGKTSTYEESFMLTDSTTPRVLKVEPQNRRQVKVTFSEAVLPQRLATNKSGDAYAENLDNYIIGGKALSDTRWGENEKRAKVEVGSGLDNQEGRETVTITLGEDKYFDPDKYTLTVRNIGDWAAATDGTNNIVTTDSKDFTVINDDTKPDIESIDVQSPEQILVTFNKPVKKDANYTNSALADKNDNIVLAVKRTGDDGTALNDDGTDDATKNSIIQLRETNGTNVGLNLAQGGINPIRVTQVDGVGRQFLIETTKDWSVAYGSQGNYNDDYFNHRYQIYIPANALVNTDNGEKNTADIVRDLSDNAVLKGVDTVAPVIDSNIGWDGSEATVRFNEPVKIRNVGAQRGLNDEGSTISVKQQKETGNQLQQATAEFVCPGKQSVAGTFDRFTDSTDTAVVVRPAEELTVGTWTLRISGVSDDFGNTTAGGGDIEVKGVETGFKVAWASVSTDETFGPNPTRLEDVWNAGTTNWDATKPIYIFVKFTNAVSTKNGAVYDMRNYTINSTNGAEIRDAYIKAGIGAYDVSSNVTDSITIVIPARSAYVVGTSPDTTTLAISNQVTSASGLTLANNAEYRLPFNSNIYTDTTNGGDNLNNKTNAVFGDYTGSDSTERANNYSSASAYKEAVEAAIKSDNYRKIILTADIVDGLNISRPVDIELDGKSIYGTTKASFTDGATCNITDKNATKGKIASLDINTPNADWVNNAKIDEVILRAIPSKTFINKGEITKIVVNTGSSEAKILNDGAGKITDIILDSVNKNGTVKIVNNSSNKIKKVTVKSPVKIEARKATVKDDGVTTASATGVIEEIVVSASKDVEVKTEGDSVDRLSGNTPAVTIKNADNEEKPDLIDEIVSDNKDGIKKAVIDSLVDTASITSGSATVKDIVRDINKTIDPNGGAITGYTIWASVDGAEAVELDLNELSGNVKADTKFVDKVLGEVENGSKIVITLRKEGETTHETIKTITVKKPTS